MKVGLMEWDQGGTKSLCRREIVAPFLFVVMKDYWEEAIQGVNKEVLYILRSTTYIN